MKLTVLTENSAGTKFNAELLNLDLETEVNTVVLNHGHWDHGDGLQYLKKKTLITHPASFTMRYRKNNHSSVGLKCSGKKLKRILV